MKHVIIFGGAGFMGSHWALYLLENTNVEKIILADIAPIRGYFFEGKLGQALRSGRVQYKNVDVRFPIKKANLGRNFDLICNFSAIHREPGHQHKEYFETNLPGAENVCQFARDINCRSILFSSSIGVYYPDKHQKTEKSIPAPISAYGSSKLIAEKIHLVWKSESPRRSLLIVRPGVVYGPGEEGNMSRLIKSLNQGGFLYPGNRKVLKSSIYIKELCRIFEFALAKADESSEKYLLLNAVSQSPPCLQDYVKVIQKILGQKKWIPSVPFFLVYLASLPFGFLAKIGIKQLSINPVRVKKLIRANNIVSSRLEELGYQYHYSLEEAFRDWKSNCPSEWS